MPQYTGWQSKAALFFCAVLCRTSIATPAVAAQDVTFFEELAATEAVSRRQAAILFGIEALSGDAEGGSAEYRFDPERPIRSDELAALLVAAGDFEESLGYSLFPGPRYALRMLRDASIYPSAPRDLAAGMPLDGTTFLRLSRSVLVDRGVRATPSEDLPRTYHRLGTTARPWVEWDIEQAAEVVVDEAEETAVTSTTTMDVRLILSPTVTLGSTFDLEAEDGSDRDGDVSLFMPASRVDFHRDGERSRTTGTLSLGRIATRGVIADGVALEALSATTTIRMSAGYTGFVAEELNALPAVLDDRDDERDRPLASGVFSPQRLLLGVEASAPEALSRQSPSVSVVALFDVESFDTSSDADRIDVTTLIAGLSGPLGVRHFYDLSADIQVGGYDRGQLGEENRLYLGWAARGRWRWYPGNARLIEGGVSVASGGGKGEGSLGLDSGDGTFTGYIPTTSDEPWSLYGGATTNVISIDLGYTRRITESVRIELRAYGLSRYTAAAVDDSEVDRESDNLPLGVESTGTLGIQIVPDLIFDLNGNIFIPWTTEFGGAYREGTDRRWTVGISITARL